MFQPAEGSEDVFPIVPVRLFSGYTSQKDEIEGTGVIYIGCHVEEILAEPPETSGSTEVLSGSEQQGHSAGKWYKQLAESTSEEHHEPSKGGKNYMACLMKREIYQVHEGHDVVGHIQGGEKILQEVVKQDSQNGRSADKIKKIDIFIDTKKEVTQSTPEVSSAILPL